MYTMYNPYPYYFMSPMYDPNIMFNAYNAYPYPHHMNMPMHHPNFMNQYTPFPNEIGYDSRFDPSEFLEEEQEDRLVKLKDYGPQPLTINIDEATKQNNTFRTALWTGKHLQVTLMSIKVGDDIGLEMHPNVDQFIRIEAGQGLVKMGSNKNRLDFQAKVSDDFAIMLPAGTWHNIINTGNTPLKVYSIYAPPQHPHGTVHVTKPVEK